MLRGRRPGSHQQIKCGICLHPERGRLDFLVCSGAGVQPTAKKFGVSYDSLRNSRRQEISAIHASLPLASLPGHQVILTKPSRGNPTPQLGAWQELDFWLDSATLLERSEPPR